MFRSAVEKAGLSLVVHCDPLTRTRLRRSRHVGEDSPESALERASSSRSRGRSPSTLRSRGDRVELRSPIPASGFLRPTCRACSSASTASSTCRARTHEGTGIGSGARAGTGAASWRRCDGRQRGRPRHDLHRDHSHGDLAPSAGASSAARGSRRRRALARCPTSKRRFAGCPRPTVRCRSSGRAHQARCPGASQPPARDGRTCPRRRRQRRHARLSRAHPRARTIGSTSLATAAPPWIAFVRHAPDLVLADVMMPSLDGFGLLREIRADEQTRSLPVILLSARAGEEARIEGLEAGADEYLVKPFSARELLASRRVTASAGAGAARDRARLALSQRAVSDAPEPGADRGLRRGRGLSHSRCQSGRSPGVRRHSGRRRRAGFRRDHPHPVGKGLCGRNRPDLPAHARDRRAVLHTRARRTPSRSRREGVLRVAAGSHHACRMDGSASSATSAIFPSRRRRSRRRRIWRRSSTLPRTPSSRKTWMASSSRANASAERLFGYTSDELVGRPVRMLIPPERQSEEDDILARLRTGRTRRALRDGADDEGWTAARCRVDDLPGAG